MTAPHAPQVHPTEARASALLQSVGQLQARTAASEKAIRDGANARLDAIRRRQEELRPQVLSSFDASTEYQSLSIEAHRLRMVVMQP